MLLNPNISTQVAIVNDPEKMTLLPAFFMRVSNFCLRESDVGAVYGTVPNRQSVTSFCISDVAECERIIQIGDWGLLIADPQTWAKLQIVAHFSQPL